MSRRSFEYCKEYGVSGYCDKHASLSYKNIILRDIYVISGDSLFFVLVISINV